MTIMSFATDPLSFLSLRASSDVSVSNLSNNTTEEYDFLSLLATVQEFNIQFIPIIWDHGRLAIGMGATSSVHESLMKSKHSFAFKRVNQRKSVSEIYKTLTSEITTLNHPTIRESANITQLQGICWEISGQDDKPWPVLVFEKSHFGDLLCFSRLQRATALTCSDRLGLCVDIGKAIMDLHDSGIVHGDIKPQNILVFEEEAKYTAKVIDFGYSSLYSNNDHKIKLPISYPWNPLEHDRPKREWDLSDAKRVDYFSFGMLCLWFLFSRYFYDVTSLPLDIKTWLADKLDQDEEAISASDVDILNMMKLSDEKLISATYQLLAVEPTLDEENRIALQGFFTSSLSSNPKERDGSLIQFLKHFGFDSTLSHRNIPIVITHTDASNFEILRSIQSFYECDYRVRLHIFKCLTQLTSVNAISFTHQLAVCYYLGFGTPRNEPKLKEVMFNAEQIVSCIKSTISKLDHLENTEFRGTRLSWSPDIYQKSPEDYARERNKDIIIKWLLQEISDLTSAIGFSNNLVNGLKSQLIRIYVDTNRLKDAEELSIQMLRASEIMSGEQHITTATTMRSLAYIYMLQGRLEESEKILQSGIKITREQRIIGPELDEGLLCLASIYTMQGRHQAAMKLHVRLKVKAERSLGDGHPKTLIYASNLAFLYWCQGRLQEAENVLSSVVQNSKITLGREHPTTLDRIHLLSKIYLAQNRWNAVKELCTRAIETSKWILGEEHDTTLSLTRDLATALLNQDQWEEAKRLAVGLIETGESVKGFEHPDTLGFISVLGLALAKSGERETAETILLGVLDQLRSKLGEKHLETQSSASNLAGFYMDQARWNEAEELYLSLLETQKRCLMEDHQSTLKSMADLATVYMKQHRWEDARNIYEELMHASERLDADLDAVTYAEKLASIAREMLSDEEANLVQMDFERYRRTTLGERCVRCWRIYHHHEVPATLSCSCNRHS